MIRECTPHLRSAAGLCCLGRRALGAVGAVRLVYGALLWSQQPAVADTGRWALTWRSIGPWADGGRVEDLVVPAYPPDRGVLPGAVMYVGSATGGLFKTVNGGVTWTPVFDREATAAIHTIAVSPTNPEVIWVGTGDPLAWHTVTPGHGVYKSLDGGAHWTNVGFAQADLIGRIVLHPTNPDVAYVGVTGSLARPGGERGVYRTTDGGRTWTRALAVNEWTGVVDLAIDLTNPTTLYAATEQQSQRPDLYVDYGPGSGIWKSTDAGVTWRRLSAGLPKGYLGRIGLAVSPARPSTVYAAVDSTTGEPPNTHESHGHIVVYRSDDFGERWERGVDFPDESGWQFGRIVAHPTDPTRAYVLLGDIAEVTDGGRTIARHIESLESGGDNHVLWIDPAHTLHWVLGSDVGVASTEDGGVSWTHVVNLPLGQFRSIDADRRSPFYYVSGESQDHQGTIGPSRTRRATGIAVTDWEWTSASEGGYVVASPVDSTTLYTWNDVGTGVVRFNTATKEIRELIPDPSSWERRFTWNPDAPILLSPHDPSTVYMGLTRLLQSHDRGENWHAISGELVRTPRDSLTAMGLPDMRERTAAYYDAITTIAESPVRPGLLYVGTQDGLVHISPDGGQHWRTIDRFPGVAAGTMVTRVVASRFDAATAYLTINASDAGDFRPHVLRTTDGGEHWTAIDGTLPATAAAWVIQEHFRTPQLLFVGTDMGVFFTTDGGRHWRSLRANMPAVRVRDLVIQPQANDVVIGTYGRSIWILDDVAPLERMAQAEVSSTPVLFPVRDAVQINTHREDTTVYRPSAVSNPPGAIITYSLPPGMLDTAVALAIVDSSGGLVRDLAVERGPGLHRIGWDLRLLKEQAYERGWPVLPDTYAVRLTVGTWHAETPLRVVADPITPLDGAVRDSLRAVRRYATLLRARIHALTTTAETLLTEVDSGLAIVQRTRGPETLVTQGRAIRAALLDVLKVQGGERWWRQTAEQFVPQAVEHLAVEAYKTVGELLTQSETAGLRRVFDIVDAQVSAQQRRLEVLRRTDVPVFLQALDAAGVPWSLGRAVP